MTNELEILVWLAGLTLFMWLPYILAHIINVGLMQALTYRADGEPLPEWAARAKRAERDVPPANFTPNGHSSRPNSTKRHLFWVKTW